MHKVDSPPPLTPEQLKETPLGAADMRFGRRGEYRPQMDLPPEEKKKPAKLRHLRNRTEIAFGVIFALIGAMMVAGALSLAFPSIYAGSTAESPVAADDAGAAEEEDRELQGGVRVRKGLGK